MKKNLTLHQQKLVTDACRIVITRNREKNLILYIHAPTGGGKTFMVSHIVDELSFNCSFTYLFIAPSTGSLSKQAYKAFKSYSKNREIEMPSENIHYIKGIDSLDSVFQKNNIYFIKWGSINNKKNILTRDGDRESLFSVIKNTAKRGIEPIVIIDEEHLYVGRKTLINNSKKILDSIDKCFKDTNTDHRQLLIRMSATPTFFQIKNRSFKNTEYKYLRMSYRDAVEDKLVKIKVKALGLDTGINDNEYSQIDIDEKNVYKEFINIAINQYRHLKNEVQKVYNKHLIEDLKVDHTIGFVNVKKREEFKKFNPLVIIQLPDDTVVKKEKAYFERIYEYLLERGFAPDQIACWLSKIKWIGKINHNNNPEIMKRLLVADNGRVSFLIFKQAIATGWDIPRATIYVRLREISSKTFKIQTLGRVLRNPFYSYFKNKRSESDLDYAYISTPGLLEDIDVDRTSVLMLKGYSKRQLSLFYNTPKAVLNRKLIEEFEGRSENFNELILNAFKKIHFVNANKSIFTYLCNFSREHSGISLFMDKFLNEEIYVQEGEHLVSNIYEKNTIVERGKISIIKIKKDVGFDVLEYLVEKKIRSLLGGALTRLVINFFMSKLFNEVKENAPKITLKWWYLLLLSGFLNDENKFHINNCFFVPEPYDNQKTYQSSIFKIISNIVLKAIIDSQNSNEDELVFFNIEKKGKNEKAYIQFKLPSQIFLNDVDQATGANITAAEKEARVHYYSPCLWNQKKWQFLNGKWSRIKKLTFNKVFKEQNIESILWDSSFEQFFYSHLVLRQKEYGINTVVRNQRDCFLDGETFGIGYLKCSYPFIERFEPDFIIVGEKNGVPYQIICDTKGNLRSYKNSTTYDDKAITKLVYATKVYHKILTSYSKGQSIDHLEVRTTITLIYQDDYKDEFYVVYYDENNRKTKVLKLYEYIDLLVGIKSMIQKITNLPYDVIKVPTKKVNEKSKLQPQYGFGTY